MDKNKKSALNYVLLKVNLLKMSPDNPYGFFPSELFTFYYRIKSGLHKSVFSIIENISKMHLEKLTGVLC